MKYKVGDKVRVRKDLKVGKYCGDDTFTEHMKEYAGKTMTIKARIGGKYRLEEDFKKWKWTDEMLEPVEDITIIVRDNKVIAKMDNKVGIAKCSPEDEFDIFTGVRLAIDRLEEKCKPYPWLKKGVMYYVPNLARDSLYELYTYGNDSVDRKMIDRGIVFKTEEEAISFAKKVLGK